MAFLKLILTLILSIPAVHAGLFNCDDVNSDPIPEIKSAGEVQVHYTEPFLQGNALRPDIHQGKKPFLIYYAVDSEEPFMRLSVDLEISRLETACRSQGSVNFVGILNSLYTSTNELIVCKEKDLSRVKLSDFPALDKALKKKREYLGVGDHTVDELGPMRIPVFYDTKSNASFARYPLAHPDFLYDLLNLVTTEERFFPTKEYMPFLNLKSHGARQFVLSGLHPCQEKGKSQSQEEFIRSNPPTNGENLLEKLHLGPGAGVGGDLGQQHLGQQHLGQQHLGQQHLGNIAGLGAGHGLGAEFAFGTSHVALNFILKRLFHGREGKVMGFVVLESCDTDRNYDFNNKILGGTLGFYSSPFSLWYRNLNWWSLLTKANGSTSELISILDETTRKIPSLEYKSSP